MIKYIVLFFLIPFTTLFGQTLNFDIMVTYSRNYNDRHFEESSYGMSTNSRYIMQISNNHDASQIAQVFDLKSLKIYKYQVIEEKTNTDRLEFKFEYLSTKPFSSYFPELSYRQNIHFDFKKIAVENDIETVELTFYKNKSKTRPRESLELKILETELHLFPLFRFTCLHPKECINELNYDQPGLVISAISGNEKAEYTLKAFEETSLEISLPN